MLLFTKYYYNFYREGSRSSARVVVPLVLQLVRPRSVIDVGCGTGAWLSVFEEYGVEDVWGVDGEYVSEKTLEIPRKRFVPHNLERHFLMDRKFDLVVSLEVAQYLHSEHAETFIGSLTGLGPVVLFSAAIPLQPGLGHINEQWPEYWAKLFRDKGYVLIDCLRSKIWCNEEVEPWYAQNIFLFAARECLEDQPLLKKEYELGDSTRLSVVHPKIYLQRVKGANLRRRLVRNVNRVVLRRMKRLV